MVIIREIRYTITHFTESSKYFARSDIAIMNTTAVTGVIIENNIMAQCDSCITYYGNFINPITTITDNQFWSINSNTLINNSDNTYCTTCSTCLSKGLSTSGYCADSNPEFTTIPTQGTAGSGNFNLLSNSPTIGQGANLSSIFTTDINNNTWTTSGIRSI